MLKHKVSHEVEAYKFLRMMAEVRWLLRPRTSRRRWQKPSIRAKEGKLLKSGWGISRPYSWGFPSWYQHRPHESYSQVHSFVFLSWFDCVSLSDSTFDGNKVPPQGIVGNHKKKQKRLTSTRAHKKLIVHIFYIVMAVINLTDLYQDLNKREQGKEGQECRLLLSYLMSSKH